LKAVAILLAAGASRRMGSPKQLLKFNGKTLLESCLEKLLAQNIQELIVVLGANAEQMKPLCLHERVLVVVNPSWEEGMGSSIRVGITTAMQLQPSHALLALVDQPFVEAADYAAMFAQAEIYPGHIIAASFSGHLGSPAIFPAAYFGLLSKLEGDIGARGILRNPQNKVIGMEMKNAGQDWDTIEDINA
jgi:molybdenum cofactor cytidylyltransferase